MPTTLDIDRILHMVRWLVSLGLALLSVGSPGAATAASEDPLHAGTIALSRETPEPSSYSLGDHGVAPRSGAATYSIPIEAPPGRLGMQPDLSLSYSSRNPLRGDVAAGWGLELSFIELDTASGSLAEPRYRASFGGNSAILVEVPDDAAFGGTTYRMEQDDAFVRFELARAPVRNDVRELEITVEDPTVHGHRLDWCRYFGACGRDSADLYCEHAFGEGSVATRWAKDEDIGAVSPTLALGGPDLASEVANVCSAPHCDGFQQVTCASSRFGFVARTTDGGIHLFGTTPTSTDGHSIWHLDRRIDAAGNAVDYHWAEVRDDRGRVVDYALEHVDYTSNETAGLEAHARVDLEYAPELDVCEAQLPRSTFEPNTDRAGEDYANFWLSSPDPAVCQQACDDDDACQAWTYVKPGLQGAQARCWLKQSVPGDFANDCCTSGTKLTNRRRTLESEVPIGAALDYRSGQRRVEGTRRLDGISTRVKDSPGASWREVQRLSLSYDEEAMRCDGDQAPLRKLTRVERRAFAPDGTESAMPPVSFEYEPWSSEPQRTTIRNDGPLHFGTDVSLDGTLLQIDGDGIPDRVSVRVAPEGGKCELVWQKGLFGGNFTSGDSLSENLARLPTLPWAGGEAGGAETCTLMGQTSYFTNVEHACVGQGSFLVYRFMDVDGDGRDDLLTALHRDPGIYEPYTTFADEIGNPYDDDGGGIPDPDPDPTPEQCPGDPREPEMLTPGYVWHLHRNIGGGFEQSGSTTYAPFSLAPVGNEGSQMGHGTRSAGRSAIRDMDGDGALDLVYTPDARSGTWVVKPYNSRGGFGPEQTWVLPGQLDLVVPSDSETDAFQSIPRRTMTTLGLADVNGDGLPDLVVAPQPLDSSSGAIPTAANQSLVAYPNYGAGFSSEPVPLGTPFAAIDWSVSNGQFRYSDFLRLDVDGDGLVDFLDLSASPPRYFPNAGDLFLAPRSLPTIWSLGQRQLRIVGGEADPQTPASYLWELWSEIADGDGDGLQDLIGISGSSRTILGLAGQNAPPHRLTKVDLGTGASIRFDYRPVTDPEVVVREGGLRSHLPSKFWVVESVTYDQEDARSGPPSVTSYAYANPVYRAEDGDSREAPRFLGFERVTTFEPRGARVERSYRYAPRPTRDARGRLASETTYDGDVPVTHREVDPWAVEPVFGHLATFTHKTAERTFHCARGDSLERCASRSDAALSVEHSYEAWPSEDAPRLYLGVSRVERGSTTGGVMNRVRTERFDVDYTAERTLVTSIYEELGDAFFDASGAAQRKLRTATLRETEYDSRGLVIARHEWINSGRTATTELQYDAAGNPIRMRKPSQVKKGGAFSEIIYGPHALYPSRSVNELGHAVETRYDVGTGRLLEKAGPNPGQYEAFAVDGFGRVLEQTVAIGDSGTPARDYTVMLMQYHDLSRPRRVVEEKRIDLEGSRWTRTEKLYDGRGRLVEEHDALGGFTIYTYDAGGTLASVEVPDPSRRSGSVLYRYERDDLGRTLGFERPDGWGLEFEYDALTTVRTEVTGDGSGGARTLHRDVFGRLVGVSEIGGQQPAETYYSYDGADRIAEIFDADGNTTWIDHDWAGRRRAIERAGRVHQYEYDWNGNLVAEISPVPEGAAVEEYTTTLAYDDLDRLVRRDPAHRGMSLARMNELGIGPVLYHYDGQAGPVELAIGRLSQVSLPFGAVSYAHDTRGLPVSEELALVSMAGLPVVAAEAITRRYNALGLPEMEVAGGDAIVRRYDQRGQAESIFWNQGLGLHRLVEYQRSAAGLVTGEFLGFDQERSYGYDVLGRPVGDEIGSRGALAAWRAYEYSDAGDLTEVRGATGSLSAAARFGYDGLHRVLWAEGPASYAGAFAYSPAGNVRSAQVGWPDSAHSRSVDYQYGAVDPQAVDALIQNGSVWASFAYDPAGNMVARRTPEGSLSLTWDGEDQIREAVASDRRGGSGKNTAKNAKSPKAEREIYYYDHEGRRLLAIGADSARLWFGPVETHFDSKGAVTRRYTHVTDGGGVVARIENGTTLEYHYTDALQNLMLVLDAAGNSSAAFLYGAFGEVVHEEGAETHRRQFNGKENDVATGLRYYGARYYDPIALRWNSADPLYEFVPDLGLEEPQRMNRYSFSLNNPLRYYDPDGRDADDDGGTCQIESEDQCAPDADEEAPMSEQETAETAEETETTEVTAGDVVGTLGMMLDYAEKAIEASGGEVPPIVTKLATHVGPMGEVLLLDDIRQDMNKDLSGEQVQRYVDFFVGAGADYVIATGDPVSKGAAAVLKGTYGTTRAFDEKIGLSDAVAEGAWRATEAVSSAANYVYEGVAGWFSD